MTEPMKGLTLWQPWASAMAHTMADGKRVKYNETRSWRTNYTGLLAIHAAKRPLEFDVRLFATSERALGRLPSQIPLGAIIATVRLDGLRYTDDIVHQIGPIERLWGNYESGRYAWMTSDLRVLSEPIPWRGAQGLWSIPDDLRGRIAELGGHP